MSRQSRVTADVTLEAHNLLRDYCKKLIDVIGKDGGFVLSPRSSTDEANPKNLKAMIDFTKEYGVYN